MGENAKRARRYLRDSLSNKDTDRKWKKEYSVGKTPVEAEREKGLTKV